jgi:hypothetical protein
MVLSVPYFMGTQVSSLECRISYNVKELTRAFSDRQGCEIVELNVKKGQSKIIDGISTWTHLFLLLIVFVDFFYC